MRLSEVRDKHRLYRPRGAAIEIWKDRSEEIVMNGPAGTGKSRASLEKIHACMEKWPGSRALMIRKTRASLTDSALVTFEQKVVPVGHPMLEGAQRAQRHSYHYPNGSEIVLGGMDHATKVMSTEYDIIYVQEAIELFENDWESLTTRLRNGVMPFQQLIADTNPDVPYHWLKQRCDRGLTKMLESRHEDNPTLWDDEKGEWTEFGRVYIGKLERLTGARYHRLRHGKWVASEGVVYENYDRAVHLIDRFEIPADWRRIRCIDFGYTNPFVCQWWAIDPDGRMYLYREIYWTERLVEEHAAQILTLSEGETIEVTIADHDAEDRATLAAKGIVTLAAHKAVSPGIQAVQLRLKAAGDGRPRIFFLRDSLVERDPALVDQPGKPHSTEQEIDGYLWAKAKDGKPNIEEPVKLNDHGMDTMRYAVAYEDLTERMVWEIL